ncbi:DinB family protein [Calditrichota bacterium]
MKGGNAESLDQALAVEAVDKLLNFYLPWIKKAVSSLNEEDVWTRPNEKSNSIGNLLLHLNGNVRQWIIHGLGGIDNYRQRDLEFSTRDGIVAKELLNLLSKTVEEACDIISGFTDENMLLESKTIQGFETTTFAAIFHVVEHFAYHTGQIVWIAKAHSDEDLKFYRL